MSRYEEHLWKILLQKEMRKS